MHKLLGIATGLLFSVPSVARTQAAPPPPNPTPLDSVSGVISATLPSGATLRGAGATVYLWADAPELHAALDAACTASRARRGAWIAARTELESPSGFPPDSVTAADLAILQRLTAIPHAVTHADTDGHFMFAEVPSGEYWISAEMMQGGAVVQWWHRFSLGNAPAQLARLLRMQVAFTPLELGTADFTRDEFCTGGEPALGAAAFEVGQKRHAMSKTPSDAAYTDVDEPAVQLDDLHPVYPEALRKAALEGTVTARFVVDSTGKVDLGTLRILSSPDLHFTDAVRDVLARERYQPARIGGRAVRSLIERKFVFSLAY